jgi:hypothetical protein
MKAKYFQFVCAAMFAAVVQVRPQPAEAAIFNTFAALEESKQFGQDVMFSSVGLLTGYNAAGTELLAGSGVLIDPWWVLTAGHVPFDEPGLYFESMRFNPSANVPENLDKFVGAAAWYTFPGYDRDVPAGKGNDIGLIRLSEPIFDVQPAQRFYGEDEVNTHLLMAGYGKPGVWPNVGAFDGIRRAGENIGTSFGTTGVTAAEEQYWMVNFSWQLSGTPLPLEWQGSDSDSGGGWFAEIDGTMQLVGISSFGIADLMTGAIRVSLYNDWIDDTIAQNSVPEPSSIAIMSIGLLGRVVAENLPEFVFTWLARNRKRRSRNS